MITDPIATYSLGSPRWTEAELQAIPYFEMVSIIWVLTIYVDNADRIGYSLLDETFWKRRIDILKDLEEGLGGIKGCCPLFVGVWDTERREWA